MKYANGREAKKHDRVVATSPAGKFIGQVVDLEGDHLRVVPLHATIAHYCLPAQTMHLDDGLKDVPPAE